MTHKFHGLSLAKNSTFDNAVFERVAATPAQLEQGRVWYNTTDDTLNFTDLDGNGAIRVNTFAAKGDLDAAIATLQAALSAEQARAEAAESAEATARAAAITAVQSALAAEVSDRTAAVAGEATARIAGDAAEAAARTAAIAVAAATSGDAVATEAAARLAGDAAANTRIDGVQAELNATQVGAGLDADGAYTAPVGSALLADATSLKNATELLDASLVAETARATGVEGALASAIANANQARADGDAALQTQIETWVGVQLTNNANADLVEQAARIAKDESLQAELDATQAAVGLATDGTLIPITGTNYLDAATTVFGGAFILDTELKRVDTGLTSEIATRTAAVSTLQSALNTEVTDRTAANAAIQTELNTTQAGAGLETNGAYAAPTGSNYLDTAVSLKDADHKLDAALKSVGDRTTVIETVSIPELQAQLTAEVARATLAESNASSGAAGAVAGVAANLATETAARIAGDATLTTALATEVTDRTAADAGLQSQINALTAAAGDGANALKTALNAGRYAYSSSAPALVHNITTNLGTLEFSVDLKVQGGDGVWRNDIAPIEYAADGNSFIVTLTESSNIKVSGQSNAQLA